MAILLTMFDRNYKVDMTQEYSFVNSDETTIILLVINTTNTIAWCFKFKKIFVN